MIGGRIINKARVRVLILTEPVKETVKHGLFESVCRIRVLPLRGNIIPDITDGEMDCIGVFWSLTEEASNQIRKDAVIRGDAFLCHSEMLDEYFILITKWRPL